MSGGVAYVLDEEGSFPARCNMGMVGFEEPSAEDDVLELRALIEEHMERTGSPVAARVLERWRRAARGGAFVKVMPHDYKRVLRERAERRRATALAQADTGGARSRQWRRGRRCAARPRARRRGGRRLMGKLGGFLQIERAASPTATPPSARTTTASSSCSARSPSCATRARAAWTAASPSATTAARSAT